MKNSDIPIVSSNEYSFLHGGGEMRKLILEKDWSNTSLGDLKTWPQSLRTMVALMLDNSFGMYIAWGADYTQLYNDGYRPILGSTKHPNALGLSSRDTFEEIWQVLGPMFDGVMIGKTFRETDFMFRLNRNGFEEDCYFDFAYSPIRKENGAVGGVLVTVIETTIKKIAEDDLIDSKQQLEFAIEAAELATWDYNPATNKFTSNKRLKEWFGLKDEHEIELQQAINSIAPKDQDRVAREIQQTLQYASGRKYDIEFTIIHPVTFQERIVRAKGKTWFDDTGTCYRLNGTVQDITEQAIARLKLEKKEEQLRIALDGGEMGTFDYFPAEGKLLWSAKTKELFGFQPDAEVNIDLYMQALHPDDRNTSEAIAQQIMMLKNGGLYDLEYRTVGITDGRIRWVRSKGIATYDINNNPVRYTGIVQDITNRKEAEQALHNQYIETEKLQRLYEAVTGNTPDLIFIFDLNYCFTYANPALLAMWGKTWEQSIGKNLLENGYEPWHAAMHEREIDTVVLTKKPIRGTVSFPHATLGKRVYDYIFAPVLNKDGNVEAVAGTTRDITEISKAEEELKRFKHMADNATDPFILIRGDGTFAYLNDVALKQWGYSREEAIHLHLSEIDMLYSEEVFKAFFAAEKIEKIPQFETLHRKKDGSIFPVEKNMGGLLLEGKPYLFAVARDITDRKKNEQDLIESEARFRLLADSMPQHIWTADIQGNLNYYNQSVYDFSGLARQQLDKDGWIQIVHPDDRKESIKAWIRAVNTGNDSHFEHRFQRFDGMYRWQLSRAVPQKDAAGKIQMWVGTSTDIQEMKEMDQQKDDFISIASHELKTPLTIAKGYLELLKMLLSEENQTAFLYVSKANQAVERLHSLVTELLDASKIQNGQLHYSISSFDFNEMIDETIENMQHTAKNHLIQKTGTVDHPVTGDKDRLQQVLINMLSNAIKYSPKADKVFIKVEEQAGKIQVSVQDFGIGMAEQHVDKIFKRYYRVKEHAVHFHGLGIGLYLSNNIIQRHAGSMWAISEPGKGSTFYFTIPFYSA